ncbi:MAG: sigma-54 dependent transcriptional regulator [Pseudomonadota bacterium]|nr:sigma-54 dependent transcriptional regulator [Pseudomonadota bacterium]
MATENDSDLWVLVIDDDRLSSHSLSILLRFVGETPVMATSESWAESLRMLAGNGAQSPLLAAAFGQIRKQPLPEILVQVHTAAPHLPLLLIGGSDSDIDEALPQAQLAALPESLRVKLLMPGEGALTNERLLHVLNEARRLTGRAANVPKSAIISPTGSALFRSLSGESSPIKRVRQLMEQVAKRPTSVLVRGESGTGKEVVARNLHYHSGRHGKPFIAVNCATIAPDNYGAELFGYEKGGDTRPGFVERADGGTLFLDEIGDLPQNIQATLLRFLEDRQFQRVGGSEVLTAEVRVVAGTRQNLEAKMREGGFREDLYYRLSVMPIELPPLRQRSEDIPELIKELISRLENCDQTSVRFNSQALQSLQKHSWPGNVRELANLVERLGIMHPNAVLGVNDLPPEYQYPVEEDTAEAEPDEPIGAGGLTLVQTQPAAPVLPPENGAMPPLNEAQLQQYLDAFERQLIEVALDDSAGMIDFAAERLQLDAASLRAMMQAHGIREGAQRPA